MRQHPKKIIQIYKETRDIQHTAELLGIHRTTVSRWLRRARSPYPYGEPRYVMRGLQRKSTRPKRLREPALSGEERVVIAAMRQKRGWCAEKLREETGIAVSVSTVKRFLIARGYIRQKKRHRRPLCQNTVHMHAKNAETVGYLQMDVKYLTPELTGLPWTCFEYAIIDIYSRYKDAVIYNDLNQNNAISAMTEIVNRLPFRTVFIQTDNGLEFQKRFHTHVTALCTKHHYIHKSSPNENAVIERSFRTDEEEFIYYKAPFKEYDDLREQYAQYLHHYNHERPHFGIDLKKPIDVVHSCANVLNH